MAEKPILFNTEMVKAILSGSKTQTRRLVKEIPLHEPYFEVFDGKPMACDENGDWFGAERFCRIQPNDVLWVRETWWQGLHGQYCYLADYDHPDAVRWQLTDGHKARPSIHMPRDAARLFLRVTNTRIERLQDISPEDCIHDGGFTREAVNLLGVEILFGALWDSTVKNADIPRYGWFANPWVWVIEFEVERR